MAGTGLGGPRVLLVEDDHLIALGLEATLVALGCAVVVHASRLPAAVRVARGERLDAALLDVKLKGELVYPVARALAERGVPFLFLTGCGANELPDAWKTVPCVPKPIDKAALR